MDCHAELRSSAGRLPVSSNSGNLIGNQELVRRLRETQALLIKFSEENNRLARDNEKLQAGSSLSCCGTKAGGILQAVFDCAALGVITKASTGLACLLL